MPNERQFCSGCRPSLLRAELTMIAINRSLGGTTRVRGAVRCASCTSRAFLRNRQGRLGDSSSRSRTGAHDPLQSDELSNCRLLRGLKPRG